MSKTASNHKRKTSKASRAINQVAPDRTVYAGFIMIGVFIVLLSVPLTQGAFWRHTALLYLGLIAIFINRAAWRAYAGRRQLAWQASLARIPLRCVGYGVKGGKPIEAAHDKPEVRWIVLISIVFSIVILAGLTVLFIPGLRP